jgi:hypothetical protein
MFLTRLAIFTRHTDGLLQYAGTAFHSDTEAAAFSRHDKFKFYSLEMFKVIRSYKKQQMSRKMRGSAGS